MTTSRKGCCRCREASQVSYSHFRRADHGSLLVQRQLWRANQAMNRVIRTPDGRLVPLRPVRLYRLTPPGAQTPVQMAPPHTTRPNSASQPAPTAAEQTTRRPALQPMPSGQTYRVTSPPEHSLVTPPLASALHQVLEQFAQANGFSAEQPLSIAFGRGTLGLHRFWSRGGHLCCRRQRRRPMGPRLE